MSVVYVRERLEELARETGIDELAVLAEKLRRRRAMRNKARASTYCRMTPEKRSLIATHILNNPDESLSAIAVKYGINAGRVSEIRMQMCGIKILR